VVITLISSLTPDDENACASALLQHFVSVLRQLPIAYAIRIETSEQVLQHPEAIGPAVMTAAQPVAITATNVAAAVATAALPLMH
jgi:hypothetical protein